MKEITVAELKAMMDEGKPFQLLDVREVHEFEEANIGGELIPLGTISSSISKIRRDIPVVIHCRSGVRSRSAIFHLESTEGFTNLINLTGGILAWAKEIDPTKQVS